MFPGKAPSFLAGITSSAKVLVLTGGGVRPGNTIFVYAGVVRADIAVVAIRILFASATPLWPLASFEHGTKYQAGFTDAARHNITELAREATAPRSRSGPMHTLILRLTAGVPRAFNLICTISIPT